MDKLFLLALFISLSIYKGEAQCPSGWTRHENNCYHFSHDTEPWMLAQEVCKLFGGYLADITSKSEDMFLQNEVQRLNAIAKAELISDNGDEKILGRKMKSWKRNQATKAVEATLYYLYRKPCSHTQGILFDSVNHWVGGNDLMNEGEWKWINTNEDLSYINWKDGEPNSKAHNENCMDIRVIPGWNDERCDISQYYICEKADENVGIIG